MYSYDTYSYMMSNVHLDTIIIAIPSDIQNHLSPYANTYTYITDRGGMETAEPLLTYADVC